MTEFRKTIIIGSGCAGLTSAIYLSRAMLDPLIITGRVWGGELIQTTDVENFPGFPDSVQGPDLIERMNKQAKKFGTSFLNENVIEIKKNGDNYIVVTDSKTEFITKTIVIATGSSTRWLGLENEKELTGFGISSCCVCDAYFFRDKDVIVVGGGDSAFEGALYLSKFCRKITIVHRREVFRASKILVDRVNKDPKIDFKLNYVVNNWDKDSDGLIGATLKNVVDDSIDNINIDGAFIMIGHTPNTSFLKDLVDLDEDKYILTQGVSTLTSLKGIFAAGDVCSNEKEYKQAVTACGSGCKAAIDLENYLNSIE